MLWIFYKFYMPLGRECESEHEGKAWREKLWSSQLPVKALKTSQAHSFHIHCLTLSWERRQRNQVLNHNFHSLNITNFTATTAAEYRMSKIKFIADEMSEILEIKSLIFVIFSYSHLLLDWLPVYDQTVPRYEKKSFKMIAITHH